MNNKKKLEQHALLTLINANSSVKTMHALEGNFLIYPMPVDTRLENRLNALSSMMCNRMGFLQREENDVGTHKEYGGRGAY